MSGQYLLEWSLKQPAWAQDALRRHAQSTGFELSEADKAAVIERLRHAAGISSPSDPDHSPLAAEHLDLDSTAKGRTLLCSLGPVKNLGRLAANQTLSFGLDGLTVIYGDNGTGKSGYCRVTKKVCRSLTSEDLLGNVFEAGDKPPAEALIRYLPHGIEVPVEDAWIDGAPVPSELRQISVFDSHNARFYVDKENRIGFLPLPIALLQRHAAHRIEMIGLFEAEKKLLDVQLKVPLPTGFTTGGEVSKALMALTIKAPTLPTADALEALAAWSEADIAEKGALEVLLHENASALAARAGRASAVLSGYLDTIKAIDTALNSETVAALADKRTNALNAVAAADLAAADAFAQEALPGVGKAPWQLMYEHARAFVAAAGLGKELPSAEGDPCALCLQPLSADASERMSRFRAFVEDAAAKAASNAKAALAEAAAALATLTVPSQASAVLALAEFRASSDARKVLADAIVAFFSASELRRSAALTAVEDGAFLQIPPAPESPEIALETVITGLEKEKIAYESQSDATGAEDVARLNVLKDREWLASVLPTILARLENLNRYKMLVECNRLANTQALSTQITSIRRKIVTNGLEERIQAEIAGLDLAHIPFVVSDLSREGDSYFGVNLKAAVEVANDQVLSEGEQRALALACFLAEVAADTSLNGLVIDDPVSSLDHLRIRRVASRLVAESAKGKQVIVFTHNLLFYNELQDAAAANTPPVPTLTQVISKSEAEGFGLVAGQSEPWTAQKVATRVGRLHARLKLLEAQTDFNTDDYRSAAKDFYTDLRETWERLVEELLLFKVVERFNSDVKTQSLKGVIVEDADYKTVFWAMKRVSERSGHDMAVGKNIPIPTPTDMKSDLDEIDSYRQMLKKRSLAASQVRMELEKPPVAKTA